MGLSGTLRPMAFWKRKTAPGTPAQGTPPAAAGEAAEESSLELPIGDALQDRHSIQVLLDAIARVSESRDLESLLEYVVDRSVEVTGAERGFLVMRGTDGEQVVRVARDRSGRDVTEDRKYSTNVVRRVLESEVPMKTTVSNEQEALELGASVYDLKLRAVMCVPLTPKPDAEGSKAPVTPDPRGEKGALYVDSKAATREFTAEDLALFFALAQHIAIALENARLNLESMEKVKLDRSLEIATEIQSGLMPKAPPTLEGWEAFGWYRPAEHASGDFYDFIKTRDGRLAVVMGDVTGHGIGPALITATAQATLRAYSQVLDDPAAWVTMLNRDMSERMDDGIFLTLFVALYSEDGTVQLLNAGATPPLLWRAADKTIEELKGGGPALGMMEDFEYESTKSLDLTTGDMIITFTDGLVEARHPAHTDKLFGDAGMRAVIADLAPQGLAAQELTESLVGQVLEFAGGIREDDMTIVTVRRV